MKLSVLHVFVLLQSDFLNEYLNSQWVTPLLLVIGILLLANLFVMLFSRRTSSRRLRTEIVETTSGDEIKVLESEIDRLNNELYYLNETNERLEAELRAKKSEIEDLRKVGYAGNEIGLSKDYYSTGLDNTSVEAEEEAGNLWYAEMPHKEGFFSSRYLKNQSTSSSLYILRLDSVNPNKAQLEINSKNELIQRLAISNSNDLLKPACNYDVNSVKGSSRIIMLQSGILIKDGEKWRIEKKIDVKFG